MLMRITLKVNTYGPKPFFCEVKSPKKEEEELISPPPFQHSFISAMCSGAGELEEAGWNYPRQGNSSQEDWNWAPVLFANNSIVDVLFVLHILVKDCYSYPHSFA